jgi:hypothetical protein
VARNRALGRAVLAVLACAACSKSVPSGEGADTAGLAVAAPAPTSPTTKGPPQMASTPDTDTVQRAIAQELKVAPGDVKVRPLRVSVPGITVFTASVDPAKAGRPVTRTGIVEGGAIYAGTAAMSRVARAWNYGARRTVPATTVAQVFGALHNETAESAPFIDDDTVQTYKKVSGPKRAAAVALPVESTVDGQPAVVYCLTSSARSTPFSIITAIVKPDFKVEIRAQPVLED